MARERDPLPITCDSVDCDADLHCFNATKEKKALNTPGSCWQCGVNFVDWDRVRRRDLNDVRHTFESLKFEKVRHHFWHKPINQIAINHSLRKGKIDLRTAVRRKLISAIGPAKPFHDGGQTTMRDDASTALPYGQHATATCCRKCLEFWHDIPRGVALTPEQLDYCTELVCLYVEDRIPEITDGPQRIPPVKKEPK